MIKNPNAYDLQDVLNDLPKHVWDSSAEPPRDDERKTGSISFKMTDHPLSRKAVKVKRKKKGGK